MVVGKRMTPNPVTVDPTTPVSDARKIMQREKIHRLPVVDRHGKVVGIVTESDLLKIFIELFGARRQGIRATILIPERPGVLAEVAQAIRDRGGDIISLGTFLGEDPSNAYCTFKVQDITREDLAACLAPHVEKITDLREV